MGARIDQRFEISHIIAQLDLSCFCYQTKTLSCNMHGMVEIILTNYTNYKQ